MQTLINFRFVKLVSLSFLLQFTIPGSFALALEHNEKTLEPDILDMSLANLMDVEITTVSKKTERLSKAAAAIFVISQEDIRRSGVTSIPEALRLAPGIQVARIDANKWAISARGFNGRFANKLLVLMDGRNLYTPLFSGVFWDVQDTALDDIERIEVIRGPGAALWGANAVNGVINIITKHTKDTKGGLLRAGGGTEEQGFGTLRYGGELGANGTYRVYGKYINRDSSEATSGDTEINDDWHVGRVGFRYDWTDSNRDNLTIQGDAYDGESGQTVIMDSITQPYFTINDLDEEIRGGNILMRWNRKFSDISNLQLQMYYDRTQRTSAIISEQRDTFDIEFQHQFSPLENHHLIWGIGYRFTQDNFKNNFTLTLVPDKRSSHLFTGFLQDDISLIPDTLRLTLGSKFSHNDYTGFEVQPNARLLWTPSDQQTIWGGVTRAVRIPSRADHDARITGTLGVLPVGESRNPFLVPITAGIIGNDKTDSEESISYELGYRLQATKNLLFDVTAFYNVYDKLRGTVIGGAVCQPSGISLSNDPSCILASTNVLVPLTFNSKLEGETYGVEVVTNWQPLGWWRLQGVYSYIQIQLHANNPANQILEDENPEGETPHHQGSIRSLMNLTSNINFDVWLRYVDELPELDIDHYFTVDARLAWKPVNEIELSIVGQNLVDRQHAEFTSDLREIVPTQIERSFYGQVKWMF